MSAVLSLPAGGGVIVVDITTDFHVTVTGEHHREEGSPESALRFARRIREQFGEACEDMALAIEDAASEALRRRMLAYRPTLPS
jgi:hypothetical protein